MSGGVLARRLVATEGAFFSQDSKLAIARLKSKFQGHASSPPPPPPAQSQADVLPEILRHSLPLLSDHPSLPPPSSSLPPPSSLAASLVAPQHQRPHISQYLIAHTSGPLAFLGSVPQTSFGPNRWKPEVEEVPILASTANEARKEHGTGIDIAKVKDVVEGYFTVFKAFAVATSLVLGGAAIAATVTSSKLQISSVDEIRTKGHDYMQPRAEAIQKHFEPWKQWVHQRSKAWHTSESHYKAVGAEFADSLGLKQRDEQFKGGGQA